MQSRSLHLAAATLSIWLGACAGLTIDDLLETAPSASPSTLDRETVVAGLQEALEIGSGLAIERGGSIDGFLANELIRVAIPPELGKMTDTLRKVGFDRQVDELEVGLNRAAEEAVGEAREVLWSEIRTLTIPDAMGLLRGGESAATDFLRARTSNEIRRRFRPIVAEKVDEVGLGRLYGDLAKSYNQLPFVTRPAVDLPDYVTDEALDGLFTLLAEEEAKIRRDPLARTTELLRRVFAS